MFFLGCRLTMVIGLSYCRRNRGLVNPSHCRFKAPQRWYGLVWRDFLCLSAYFSHAVTKTQAQSEKEGFVLLQLIPANCVGKPLHTKSFPTPIDTYAILCSSSNYYVPRVAFELCHNPYHSFVLFRGVISSLPEKSSIWVLKILPGWVHSCTERNTVSLLPDSLWCGHSSDCVHISINTKLCRLLICTMVCQAVRVG